MSLQDYLFSSQLIVEINTISLIVIFLLFNQRNLQLNKVNKTIKQIVVHNVRKLLNL